MQVIRGEILESSFLARPLALTLGNFDGVHRGHQALLAKAQQEARGLGAELGVFTLDPHPQIHFQVGVGFQPLQSLEDRLHSLEQCGVDLVFIQNFHDLFSRVTPEDFLRQYLIEKIRPLKVVFGYDFRFGRGGKGDHHLARQRLEESGITFEVCPPLKINDVVVSSRLIRDCLQKGLVEDVIELLGRPFAVAGQVMEGAKLGRTIGVPTANLAFPIGALPMDGVYGGHAEVKGKTLPALLNIGHRPTVGNGLTKTVECHILDFSDWIYGETLKFNFEFRLRGERKFQNLEELKKQIQRDVIDLRQRSN